MTNKSFCKDISCSNSDIFISIIILIIGMSIRRMKQQRQREELEEVTSSLQTVGFNLVTVNLGVGVSAVAMGVTA